MNILQDFIDTVKCEALGVYGTHIYQFGQTIASHRFRNNDPINLCSASKTFVGVAVGIAEREGILAVDNVVLDYFPEFQDVASVGSNQIRIKHLLTMTSGHVNENFSAFNLVDRAELFFREEVINQPGTQFYYEDLASYMLGRIIEKITGETLLKYLKPRLFYKLGILNPQWHTCQLDHTSCAGGLHLTTEEFAKIGILLLGNGLFNKERIITSDYTKRMHSQWIDTSFKIDEESRQGYGYQVWNCSIPNTYRADGMYGQFCIILEDFGAVITINSHNEENPKDILRAVYCDVLPKLKMKNKF